MYLAMQEEYGDSMRIPGTTFSDDDGTKKIRIDAIMAKNIVIALNVAVHESQIDPKEAQRIAEVIREVFPEAK